MTSLTYQDIINAARTEAGLYGPETILTALQEEGRITFGAISKRIIRDRGAREAAIAHLVNNGQAVVEVKTSDVGRPTTWLVKP